MTGENEEAEVFQNSSHSVADIAGQSTTTAVNTGGSNSYENRLESFSAGCVYHDYSRFYESNNTQATPIHMNSDAVDTQLVTTLYHYGRYLLLSSGNRIRVGGWVDRLIDG
jgi:hypothetical protein